MDNKLLLLMSLLSKFDYFLDDIDEDDIEYYNNKEVQDAIFDTYIDILKIESINDKSMQDLYAEKIANDFRLRISNFSQEEKEYISKKIHFVLNGPDGNQKHL